MTQDVENRAVQLRRYENLKLPDAIVAATALIFDADLLTNDKKLQRVPGLRFRELKIERKPSKTTS